MDRDNLQWLLSLSLLSLLGPKCDIDKLVQSGFYKKGNTQKPEFSLNIDIADSIYSNHKKEIHSFLDKMNVVDKDSFHQKVRELLDGSLFSTNIDKMMTLGQLMSYADRVNITTMFVNKHPYNKDFFNHVMTYEFRWPINGLYAYDIANVMMLLRLGIEEGFLIEEDQYQYLEEVLNKFKDKFVDYKKFGEECSIGRELHVYRLKATRSVEVIEDQEQLLSIAYYGVWQYLEAMISD